MRYHLVLISVLFLSACGTEPVPLNVEIRNDWDAADRFTVEQDSGATPLVETLAVSARQTGHATTPMEVRPGDSLSLRLVRTVGGDATFFRTITVPEGLSDGATLIFHLATDKSTPACPSDRTTCVLWSWAGQASPPELF